VSSSSFIGNPNNPIIHGVNLTVWAVPETSIAAGMPENLTVVLTALGICWYTIILVEKILYWMGKHKKEHPEESAKDAPEPRVDQPPKQH